MATASARHILIDIEKKCNELKEEIENGAYLADVAETNYKYTSCADGGVLEKIM